MPTDLDPFRSFPDTARIWLYAASRVVDADQSQSIVDGLAPFLDSWTSHRRGVRGACAVLESRFLAIVAFAQDGDLSGCGIDKSVHQVDAIGRSLGIVWHSALDVAWRGADGSVEVGPRSAFRRAAAEGRIGPDTPVFNLAVETLGDVRAGRFEIPAADSWHARAFGIRESAT